MKRYSPNKHVPMKFHNLYVYLLNPIGILIRAGIAGLVLLMLLGKTVIPASYQPFDDIAARYGNGALWVVFAFAAFAFLFALWAEVLLAKRRPLGVMPMRTRRRSCSLAARTTRPRPTSALPMRVMLVAPWDV